MTSYLLSYDISEDALRLRLSKLLEREGCKRLQKSVFLAANLKIEELRKLKVDIQMLFQKMPPKKQDSLLCLSLSRAQSKDMLWLGDAKDIEGAYKELSVYIV